VARPAHRATRLVLDQHADAFESARLAFETGAGRLQRQLIVGGIELQQRLANLDGPAAFTQSLAIASDSESKDCLRAEQRTTPVK